jgi:dGTPase
MLAETARRIATLAPSSVVDIRSAGRALAGFSPRMEAQAIALKQFLFARMYRHERVMNSMNSAKELIAELFAAFLREPSLLPADWAAGCGTAGDAVTAGVVRDYIAGMTDDFALKTWALKTGKNLPAEIAPLTTMPSAR